MLPTLQIGSLALPTYPLALLVAGWVALLLGARSATRSGLHGDHIYNLGLYGLLGGVLAGRLAHVIAFWPAYRTQPLEIIGLNTGALLVWPGVVGGLAVATWYIVRNRLPWGRVLDASATGLLVGLVIAGVGALLAGRGYGRESDLPWAINLWGVMRHPVQLYEAAATAIVLGIVLLRERRQAQGGRRALVALLGYGLVRWLLEPFRAASPLTYFGLRIPQLLGLAVAIFALYLLLSPARFDRAEPAEQTRVVQPKE